MINTSINSTNSKNLNNTIIPNSNINTNESILALCQTLNKEQKTAVDHVNGPMMVVAGPGSGKTFLLTERIINLISKGISADNILVITFTRKAALEMENRFKKRCGGFKYPVRFGTFHAVFFHILKYHGIYNRDSIIDEQKKLKLIEEAGMALRNAKCRQIAWQQDMLMKISFYKNQGDKLFTEPSFLMNEESIEEFIKIYDEYIYLCKRDRKLDFDDITLECLKLLTSSEDIRVYWQNIFKYILVDEFQDINRAQYNVLKLLCNSDKNVFVVGDDDQSIYGFRGATPGIMNTFTEDYIGCRQIFLKRNYRSCYQVVNSADTVIRNNKKRLARDMQLVEEGRMSGDVIAVSFENAHDEAAYIINEIRTNRYEDVAIIYRSEHCVGLLEEYVKTEGISYDKKCIRMSFYEINIVSIVLSYMRIAIGKGDRQDYLRIINHPERGLSREAFNSDSDNYLGLLRGYHDFLGKDFMARIDKLSNDLQIISELNPMAALVYLLKGVGLKSDFERIYVPDKQYPLNLEEVIEGLEERLKDFKTLEELVKHIDRVIRINKNEADTNYKSSSETKARITFITAHASKGLEYPVVFIAGLQENLFPHHKYLDAEGIEEERRLFYVAMTRAKDKLYICGRGTEYGKRVSRFLSETGVKVLKH